MWHVKLTLYALYSVQIISKAEMKKKKFRVLILIIKVSQVLDALLIHFTAQSWNTFFILSAIVHHVL